MLFGFESMNVANYNLNIRSGLLPYYLPNSLAIEDIQEDKEIKEIEQYLTPEEILKIIDKKEINFLDIDYSNIESGDENEELLK